MNSNCLVFCIGTLSSAPGFEAVACLRDEGDSPISLKKRDKGDSPISLKKCFPKPVKKQVLEEKAFLELAGASLVEEHSLLSQIAEKHSQT